MLESRWTPGEACERYTATHGHADNTEGQEAWIQFRPYRQVLPALFRRTPGRYHRDCHTSASHDGLQGDRDP
jgi:hypothetical protein